MTEPPPSLAEIARAVDAAAIAVIDAARQEWAAVTTELAEPFDAIRTMLAAGGKRVRAAFCHWAFVGAGGDPADPRVASAGAAFELMHAFALFHDDVIDDAPTRRGEATVHAVYAQRHRDAGWAGEPRRFGEGVAILVGDLASVLADELLVGVDPDVRRLWNELRIELTAGQFLDVYGAVRRDRDLAAAERVARLKSGKYSVERPLHVGAALAGRGDLLDSLSRFGLPLGDAFQLRDDVIGAFGDPARTGKPVGGDLVEAKATPLLARAVARATPDQRAVLDLVGSPDLDAAGVADVQSVIVATGALDAVEAAIAARYGEALAALADLDLAGPARNELAALAEYAVSRDR